MKTFHEFLQDYLIGEEVIPFHSKNFEMGDEVKVNDPTSKHHNKVGFIMTKSLVRPQHHRVVFPEKSTKERLHPDDVHDIRTNYLIKTGKKF